MKLPAPAGPAPAAPVAPATPPAEETEFGGQPPVNTDTPEEAPTNDMPFEKEPFDAGLDVDEESDPKKFIEQLSGKLGQSLRDYSDQQGQPDFDLEKFAINSLISATHTSEMDEKDRDDIINKINSAGEDDLDGGDQQGDELGGEEIPNADSQVPDEEGLEEIQIFETELPAYEAKRMSIFAPEGSPEFIEQNRMAEGLIVNGKNGIFGKNGIKSKLQETFNQETTMEEPIIEPITKPTTKPSTTPTPSRRNKPFTIEPDTMPDIDPKAVNESFGNEREYEFNEKYKEAENDAKKKINIKDLAEMKDLMGNDDVRLKAVVDDIRKEIANMNIQNDVIAATDNQDTVWIFNVLKIADKIYLEFNGTAK